MVKSTREMRGWVVGRKKCWECGRFMPTKDFDGRPTGNICDSCHVEAKIENLEEEGEYESI